MKKENIITLFILTLFCLPYIFPNIFVRSNDSRLYIDNKIRRIKNGVFRFEKRLETLWPMHIFFLALFTLILIASILVESFNIESYLISYASLLITVYFLDFLYSEQRRRETANKRYLIDWKVNDFIRTLEFGISDLFFYDIPDEDGFYPSSRIFDLDPEGIRQIISTDLFWETEINLKLTKGFDYWIKKDDFLNQLLDKTRKDINITLTRYSDIILYEDFKRIHELDEILNNFYLKEQSEFKNMNQQFVAVTLNRLTNSIYNASQITNKWYG